MRWVVCKSCALPRQPAPPASGRRGQNAKVALHLPVGVDEPNRARQHMSRYPTSKPDKIIDPRNVVKATVHYFPGKDEAKKDCPGKQSEFGHQRKRRPQRVCGI